MKRVNINDAEVEYMGIDAGGGNMWNYQNEPFTGILEEFYENGNLIAELECRNGYTYGLQRLYFENGQIEKEYYKKFNHFYDAFKIWNEDGILTGHFEYDQDGELISKIVGG
ncbi:toxin-antitoxin system YwqK family antitoxin [Pedobacter gandavensis]|uniref:Toxin-antitoxin system YwqK family antitoxin n=1 Tax=Pedobacter gandavensis TaxID=2679963 RepID=A0ABR6EZ47_9SPHI|nr:hypothetical protein [Pedobacter gandavensis]MBB2150531.1 hypothetical protein [Pedobacter gandavensis]